MSTTGKSETINENENVVCVVNQLPAPRNAAGKYLINQAIVSAFYFLVRTLRTKNSFAQSSQGQHSQANTQANTQAGRHYSNIIGRPRIIPHIQTKPESHRTGKYRCNFRSNTHQYVPKDNNHLQVWAHI
ncbi:hypothetical protein O988_09090 [Pseudogymnoascus sp. VKM F-3808]|nr:hypothetical protein O988_09090 [Pseudogymnoascus sp. VKM F-3808]